MNKPRYNIYDVSDYYSRGYQYMTLDEYCREAAWRRASPQLDQYNRTVQALNNMYPAPPHARLAVGTLEPTLWEKLTSWLK